MPNNRPVVFLLDAARRQFQQISAEPCLAWMLGWRTAERIEILNVCRFLAKDGRILKTTDVPYSLEQEIAALNVALPHGIVPLGCAAVFGDDIHMSVFTLVKSLGILSKKAVSIDAPSANTISGVWCVGRLITHMDKVGCDFEDLAEEQSVFLSTHRAMRWMVDVTVPVLYKDQDSYADLWVQFQKLLDSLKMPRCILCIEDSPSNKQLITADSKMRLSEMFENKTSELECQLLADGEGEHQCPLLRLHEIKNQEQMCAIHFSLEGYAVPLSVIYPFIPGHQSNENSQVDVRKQMHRRFLQKEDHPVFLSALSLDYAAATPKTERPVNIHEHLPEKSFPEGGMMAMVSGRYEYCHYGHDNYNDQGWGCAYRSLQTVFSWFVHQHYTTLPIPSHRKIQQVLVELGDKEGRFYGSREWIGSIEVGTVLQEMLGVTYHVVSKPAHQDVSSIARELLHHFQTQGTPVSIGGGVLAYTLLGIYFNDQTAEVELLILDPHYTGKDNVESILKGGWVAWKKPTDNAAAGGPLFVKNTHYNFMCTKRPAIV